jgi:GTPase Era involved in 16S rRNA processing
MSSKIFEEVELQANVLSKYWHNFYSEISQYLPESYQPEMQELSLKLGEALETLISELHNPTLTLATTGTTSSGKSTLVNLLCGAEIVPVAVSEMSAGVVTIEYSEEKSLVIHETPGAEWECGEWRGIHEDEICQRLYNVMISYIDNREKYPDLACPKSTIGFPFRLLKESNLQLPKGTRVRIMDLPGLAYVGDEGNASVIRQCREALCIVTYNSQENDPPKVRNLLQEVVEQVKDLGGSPARMLFVLNKIDVFRTDRSWPESEERFVKKTVDSIKTELLERLKEYTQDIEKLQVVKLSTLPALLSLQIRQGQELIKNVMEDIPKREENRSAHDRKRFDEASASIKACEKAQDEFYGLIKDTLKSLKLSRETQDWSLFECGEVAEVLWKTSYAQEFQQHLKDHVTNHFPQLVIPQMIERFNTKGGNAVSEWATQTTTAILNSSKEQYLKECANIAWIRSSLERFLEVSDAKLREPFEKVVKIKQLITGESEEDPALELEKMVVELKYVKPYDELGDKLYPLYGWRRELGQGINQVLEAVAKSLESGKVDLEGTNLKKANYLNINLLGRKLTRLINLGYTGSVAKSGKTVEAKTSEEKLRLTQMNEELNELSIHLSIVMEDVLKQISGQELNRMYQAVEELFNCHLSYLEKGANDIAPNLGIKLSESRLSKVDRQPSFNFKFEAGFVITQETWMEKVPDEKQKRFWWWNWLSWWRKDYIYETRSSDNAKVPNVEDLLTGWIIQAKKEEPEIVNQISTWLLEQIDCLKQNVGQVQSHIIDRYQARLDRANQEVTLDYERQKNVWEPIQKKALSLAEEFSDLGESLKKES